MTASILFVDDDEGNLVVCEAVCSEPFRVLTAKNADEALVLLSTEEIGVVVADQRMPGKTGVALLEKVQSEYPDVVRILITAYSDLSAAIDAINRGKVHRYLKKPWEPEALRAELKNALEVYEMSKKLSALEIRLRETERVYALGVVAAGIGHELRNPASWIRDNVVSARAELTLLEALVPNEAKTRGHIKELADSLEDAHAGILRVLDIVQGIELPLRASGALTEQVDLSDVLRLTLRLVRTEIKRSAELELDATAAPRVLGSSTKVGQVILNLLVNAMQAVAEIPRERRTIRVSLKSEGPWACLEVADSGPGIPPAEQARIFDPFYTTKTNSGSGLGLAISREIATELGGSLDVSTDEKLGGALFTLRLPAL